MSSHGLSLYMSVWSTLLNPRHRVVLPDLGTPVTAIFPLYSVAIIVHLDAHVR